MNENRETNNDENIDVKVDSDVILDNKNYIKADRYTLIKLAIIVILIVILFVTEHFYNEPLFKESLTFEKKWQQKHNRKESPVYHFFNVITIFGTLKGIAIVIVIVYFISPLNHSLLCLFGISFTSYITNVLKNCYKNDRPYWRDESLQMHCNGGYGNPSGYIIN